MSLNKLTNSSDYLNKQYLNIGCNDIKCSTLNIAGTPVIPANIPVSGKYNANIVINVAGSNDLDGWVYYEKIGNQLKLSFGRLYTLGANAANITFTMDLPVGYTAIASITSAGVAFTTNGGQTSNMTQAATDVTGTKIVVSCEGPNNLSAGTCFFNGSLVVEL
jgi:hypothetical protein